MNVYQLRPKGGYCGGLALVAAPSFESAKQEYLTNGKYSEEYYFGEFAFNDDYSEPLKDLEWHGERSIICESFYFE